MNNKHAFVIFITAVLLIAFTLIVLYNNAGVDVVNPRIITNTAENNTSYELNYSLAAGGNFEVLDCECAYYTSDDKYIGNSSTVLDDVKIGGIPVTEKINMENSNMTPQKVKISIFKQKLSPDEKLGNGTYAVDAFYEKTFDIT